MSVEQGEYDISQEFVLRLTRALKENDGEFNGCLEIHLERDREGFHVTTFVEITQMKLVRTNTVSFIGRANLESADCCVGVIDLGNRKVIAFIINEKFQEGWMRRK